MSEIPGDERLVAGRYRLLSRLGEGGMGVVWRARDEVLQREVAVKEVRAPAALGDADVGRLYARLEREAWAAARISHRNVVTVYDVANEDGRPWIVMELIRGLALSDELAAQGPMPPERAAGIGAEVLAALRCAHEAGVLHRDVKPGNVLLANDGRVVLTDFGIASVEGTSSLTMTGELIGSPEYLAPERALGRTPGPESDLWSLGVLLYASVENNSPFRRTSALSTMRAVVDQELPPPRRAGALAPVIAGLLEKEPEQRITAADAESWLRTVATGATSSHSATAPARPVVPAAPLAPGAHGPYVPTVGAVSPSGPATPPESVPLVSSSTTGVTPRPPRSRRAGIRLAAGVAVLVLALGGLAWALSRNDDSGGGKQGLDTGGNSQQTSPGSGSTKPEGPGGPADGSDDDSGEEEARGSDDDTGTGPGPRDNDGTGWGGSAGSIGGASDGNGGKSAGSGSGNGTGGGSGGHTTTPPKQTVHAQVTEVRAEYSGPCPPPESHAPAYSGSFTVGHLPATVRYRWVGESDSGLTSGWQTLDFAAGGIRSKTVHVTLALNDTSGSRHDRIKVEVSSPVQASSTWVQLSVTCSPASPGGGNTPGPAGNESDRAGTEHGGTTDAGPGTPTGL